MASKGLGTGLGALFGDAALGAEPNDFEYLPLTKIEPRPDQPRSVFEQEKIDELSDSIKEHGVLSPLTVRHVGEGYYQIIAGERRWRAARAAGLTEVPARVIVADDRKAAEIAMVENLQREDLSPIEEARGYRALMDEFEMTQEEVAQKVSKSRPAIANSLRLLSLPDELLQMVGGGSLPAGSARALLGLRDRERMLTAAQTAVSRAMSVREVEQLVKKLNSEKPERSRAARSGLDVDYVQEAQTSLTKALGRRVSIAQGRHKGRIEIEYYDQEDFNQLFVALKALSGLEF